MKLWQTITEWTQAAQRDVGLRRAAETGDTETVQRLLDQGADLEARRGRDTALMLAVAAGHVEMIRLLLNRGANYR